MQRMLIARGDGLHEADPVVLRDGALRLVCIKNVTERPWRTTAQVLLELSRRFHGLNFAVFCALPASSRRRGKSPACAPAAPCRLVSAITPEPSGKFRDRRIRKCKPGGPLGEDDVHGPEQQRIGQLASAGHE